MTHHDYIPAIRPWNADLTPAWTPPAEPTSRRGVDWIAVERFLRGTLPPTGLQDHERLEVAAISWRTAVPVKDLSKRLQLNEYATYELLAAAGVLPPENVCTVEGCWHARSGNGLCKRHLANERTAAQRVELVARVRRLHHRGRGAAHIAKRIGKSPYWVKQILTELGLDEQAADIEAVTA